MRLTAFLGVVVIVLSAAAQTPKEPWKWTTEERLRSRFDATARRLRVAEAQHGSNRAAADASRDVDVIDGRLHPELFLPSELFEAVVFLRVWKPQWLTDEIGEHSDDLLRSEAERGRFAEITATYGATLLRERALLTEQAAAGSIRSAEIEKELETLRKAKHDAEAIALRDARKAFGRDRFDRFLYTVVAPGRKKFVLAGTSDEATAKALRARARETQ